MHTHTHTTYTDDRHTQKTDRQKQKDGIVAMQSILMSTSVCLSVYRLG